ncbi:MAG: hypothetical protein AAGE65_12930 [Planctomycetota bacterium]
MTTALPDPTVRAAVRALWRRWRTTPWRDRLRGRLTARFDTSARLADSALSPPTRELIREVIRRTRLRPGEKSAVADELLAHFHDGVGAGTEEQELRSKFGHPATAARLIRRAKRRCRSRLWHAWRAAWWSTVFLLAAYTAYGVAVFTGRPNIQTNYHALLYPPPTQPQEQWALPRYEAALAALDLDEVIERRTIRQDTNDPIERLYWDYGGAGYSVEEITIPITREQWLYRTLYNDQADPFAILAGYFNEYTDAFEQIRAAAALPTLGPLPADRDFGHYHTPGDPAHPLIGAGLLSHSSNDPRVDVAGEIETLLVVDAEVAARQGDGPRAVASLEALMSLDDQLAELPVRESYLGSIRLRTSVTGTLGDLLATRPETFGDSDLRRLAERLAEQNGRATLEQYAEVSRIAFLDLLQRVYTDDGEGDGRMTIDGLRLLFEIEQPAFNLLENPEAVAQTTLSPGLVLIAQSRRDAEERFEAALAQIRQQWDESLTEHVDRVTSVPRRSKTWRRHWEGLRFAAVDTVAHRSRMSGLLAIEQDIRRDAVLVGIALELYRRAEGQWPESLDALVPSYLPAIPDDPFADAPMRYLVHDGRPRVYSVGPDGDDDGGRAAARPPGGVPTVTQSVRRHRLVDGQPGFPDHDWVLFPLAHRLHLPDRTPRVRASNSVNLNPW